MDNVSRFKEFCAEKNIPLKETYQDGSIYCRTFMTLPNGALIKIAFVFSENQSFLDIQIYELSKITDPLKKESLLQLVNELNKIARYGKFTETEGEVIFSYHLHYEKEMFRPLRVITCLAGMIRIIENAYPELVRLQWA